MNMISQYAVVATADIDALTEQQASEFWAGVCTTEGEQRKNNDGTKTVLHWCDHMGNPPHVIVTVLTREQVRAEMVAEEWLAEDLVS